MWVLETSGMGLNLFPPKLAFRCGMCCLCIANTFPAIKKVLGNILSGPPCTYQFRTLLDTGAQLSLVSEDFLKLCDPHLVKSTQNSTDVSLRSATGHSLEVSKVVRIRITLGKVRMYHDFIVVKDFKHDMILGIDFLTARKAILDFDSQTLVIKNSVYPLKTKPGQEQTEVSLVRLADVDVFPRSDVQVKCSVSKKKQAGENLVVSQLPSSPYVSRPSQAFYFQMRWSNFPKTSISLGPL